VGSITDDGIGIPPDAQPGVGTRSFRDRAEELGGTVTVRPGPTGGTEVRIVLPIGPP
jgi:signal transduction histidine kinase